MSFSSRPTLEPAGVWALLPSVLLLGLLIGTSTSWAVESLTLDEKTGFALARPGRTLRLAIEARERGDRDRSNALLAEVSSLHSVVADYADMLLLKDMLEVRDAQRAIEFAKTALKRHRNSPLRYQFHRLLGDARLMTGDERKAREAWELSLLGTRDEEFRAELSLEVARSLERTGDASGAALSYRRLWFRYPTQDQAKVATERLSALEKELGFVRTAHDYLKRGDALFDLGWSEEAFVAYEGALARGLSRKQRRHAERRRAHCLFRLRRYPEAVTAFSDLRPGDESELWYTRSLARAGDVPAAIRGFEALAKSGSSRSVRMRAHFLAASLLEGRNFQKEAIAHYVAVAKKSRDDSQLVAAHWKLGWLAYRNGEFQYARKQFASMEKRAEFPTDKLQARYWTARALESEDFAKAQKLFSAISQDAPFSYYGWRAEERIEVREPFGRPPDAQLLSKGRSGLPEAELERVRILLEAGLLEEMDFELHLLERRARGLSDRLELAGFYTDVGDFHRAQKLIVDAYEHSLIRGVQPGQEEAWWFAWPQAYEGLVEDALPERSKIEDVLVFSIMREESSYRPWIVSGAGARGLLQIMPGTGNQLAERTGLQRFSAEDLFRPDVNIQLGAFYLDELTRRFQGRLSAAVGSYNAGPEAIASWIKENPTTADDEWVELIPYSQTKGYVKRVLRSMYVYRTLY